MHISRGRSVLATSSFEYNELFFQDAPRLDDDNHFSAPLLCFARALARAYAMVCAGTNKGGLTGSVEDMQAWTCRPVALKAAKGGGFTGATAYLTGWAEASVASFGLRGAAGVVQRCDAAWGGELRGEAEGVGADGCEGHV